MQRRAAQPRLIVVGIGPPDGARLHGGRRATAGQRRRVLREAAVVGRADIERHARRLRRCPRAGSTCRRRRRRRCRVSGDDDPKAHAWARGTGLHAVAQNRRKNRRLLRLDHNLSAVGTDRAGMQRRATQPRLIVVGIGAPDGARLRSGSGATAGERRCVLREAAVVGRADIERHALSPNVGAAKPCQKPCSRQSKDGACADLLPGRSASGIGACGRLRDGHHLGNHLARFGLCQHVRHERHPLRTPTQTSSRNREMISAL